MYIKVRKMLILAIAVVILTTMVMPAAASATSIPVLGDIIDSAKDGLQSFSEWNQGQQNQFWNWVDNQTSQSSSSSPAPAQSSVPATPDNEPSTAPTPEGSTTASSGPSVPAHPSVLDGPENSPVRSEIPEITEWTPVNENIIDSDSQGLETGYYIFRGTLYHYDAETGEMKPVPIDYNPSSSGDNYHIVINGSGNQVTIGAGDKTTADEPAEIDSATNEESSESFPPAVAFIVSVVILVWFWLVIRFVVDWVRGILWRF